MEDTSRRRPHGEPGRDCPATTGLPAGSHRAKHHRLRNQADCWERLNVMQRVMIVVCLLAALAGCGVATTSANGTRRGNEVKARMNSSPPAPHRPPGGSVTVTGADQGAVVYLHIGQRLHVVLDGHGEQWVVPSSAGAALRRAAASGGYPTGKPADAVFLAVRAGIASITSMTDYACLHAQPPCSIPQRAWAVRVVVSKPS